MQIRISRDYWIVDAGQQGGSSEGTRVLKFQLVNS